MNEPHRPRVLDLTEPSVTVTLTASTAGWEATVAVDSERIWHSESHPSFEGALDAARVAILGSTTAAVRA